MWRDFVLVGIRVADVLPAGAIARTKAELPEIVNGLNEPTWHVDIAQQRGGAVFANP
ncbi:hypothetical protein CBM2598_U40008 [Cupriavidus taiwanensis]|uniref:Uncharacterized protein n=1 Tax=Cupriavidus taiwanensis TaxID=164546 RepID=A0A7Z7NRF7_9BURK|nr:hypothetical protein CBM2597_U40010 [Cupriavidus taiwanensis]SOZ97212.1 hypothetical protein CBM2598_U40008 [Cupriavidus taiwanensis]SPC26104.1 hypothetical protein CBM2594_U40009 [Cupriavidus taiwanensis]